MSIDLRCQGERAGFGGVCSPTDLRADLPRCSTNTSKSSASQGAERATRAALVETLCHVLRLAAGRLDVSQWTSDATGVRRVPRPMRQHFARRYATDGLYGSDLQASEHLDVVRDAFNSPFLAFRARYYVDRAGGPRLSLVLPCRGALESPSESCGP